MVTVTIIVNEPPHVASKLAGNFFDASELNKITIAFKKNFLKSSVNLNISFQSQAPFGNWNMPYQEACEEAALILAHYYYSGKHIDPQTMQKEILSLVDWENKTFGYYKDTDSLEMARTWKEYFGHRNVEPINNFTLEDLKYTLASGYPVIIPAAGRLLRNPYFTKPGPVFQHVLNAAHDFDSKNILNGHKIMIILRS